MDIRSQISMVFHLDKCIGCHTCSIACKNIWTDRKGAEYMWWNNVETKPGTGYPTKWEDQSIYKGGWESVGGAISLKGAGKQKGLLNIFHNPNMPVIDDYYEPFTYDYLHLIEAPAGDDQPTARPISLITGKPIDIKMGPNWDDDLSGSPDFARNDPNLQESVAGRAGSHVPAGTDGVLLPAAHLQSLPESGLRRLLPVGRDLQAGRGRRGSHQPGRLPRLANVRHGLPVQEVLLQLAHGKIRKVHPVLSAHRGRPCSGLHALPASAGSATWA